MRHCLPTSCRFTPRSYIPYAQGTDDTNIALEDIKNSFWYSRASQPLPRGSGTTARRFVPERLWATVSDSTMERASTCAHSWMTPGDGGSAVSACHSRVTWPVLNTSFDERKRKLQAFSVRVMTGAVMRGRLACEMINSDCQIRFGRDVSEGLLPLVIRLPNLQ